MKYKEDDLQKSVARYLDLKKVLWFHPANERKTSPQQGKRLKDKGVKSGVPDCMILTPKGRFKGLALELKITKDNGLKKNGEPKKPTKGVLSDTQREWLISLTIIGWETKVAYNLDEAIRYIDEYLEL